MVARFDRYVLIALVLLGGALAGCYDAAAPDAYPLRVETQTSFGGLAYFADLDGDGIDEAMVIASHAGQSGHVGLLLYTLGGAVIEQVNVPDAYQLASEGRPHALDLDGDGRLEVVLPIVRRDSLFARVYEADGGYRQQLFLASGEPRRVEDGELAWDPAVWGFFLEDVTGDGRSELVTAVRTGYARYPRGLLVHDLDSGERVGELLVGANMEPESLIDFDGDGRRELLFDAGASNNGARAGGFSDDRAYAGVVDLAPPLRVRWSRMADRKRYAALEAMPLATNGSTVIVAETVGPSRPGPSSLRVIDPETNEVTHAVQWTRGVARVYASTGHDGEPLVYLADLSHRVVAMSASLEVLAHRAWDERVGLLSPVDLDGDGTDEVLAYVSDRYMWLGPDLVTRAVIVGKRGISFGPVRQGAGRPPLIYGQRTDYDGLNSYTALYRVEANPWWWLHRYGPGGLAGFGVVALLGVVGLGARHTRRRRLAEAVRERVLAGDERGMLLLRPDGGVAEANPAFRHRFGLNGEAAGDLRHALAASAPEFEGFLRALAAGPPHRREAAVDLAEGDAPPSWVVAEPLEVERRGRPYWLVSVTPAPVEHSVGDETWPLLARRVVHDLKNPLTSILLTLQRMQMEAHAHASSDVAARLDPYVERVEGRVEHLRRMAQNLLKFLDAAQPELAEADLCAVVERCVEGLRPAMPPDVRLALRRCTEPVPVLCDAEQVGSALENLVMNAVQAMPDGGRVTVQARVARRLQPEGAPAPRDYAVLEVLDTGRGMDAEARRRAFEPGFTTRDGGTGLGLALVRKVVRDHGGFATVESEPGAGTAVCLHLPLASHAPLAARDPDEPTATRDAAAA